MSAVLIILGFVLVFAWVAVAFFICLVMQSKLTDEVRLLAAQVEELSR